MGEVALRGFQVVVVAVDPCLRQALYLFFGEDADRGSNFDVDFCLNRGDGLFELAHQALVGSFDGGNDTKFHRARLCCLFSSFHKGRDIEPRRPDGRFEKPRLCTEVAVFRAPTRFQGDNSFCLNCVATPAQPNLVCQSKEFVDTIVGNRHRPNNFWLRKPFPTLKNLFAGQIQNVLFGRGCIRAGERLTRSCLLRRVLRHNAVPP